ncbi:hypothetical protein GPALN_011224 [Globodera pallida]|nr:hypothetical protein GPALN_011224 [Globodera pallida]
MIIEVYGSSERDPLNKQKGKIAAKGSNANGNGQPGRIAPYAIFVQRRHPSTAEGISAFHGRRLEDMSKYNAVKEQRQHGKESEYDLPARRQSVRKFDWRQLSHISSSCRLACARKKNGMVREERVNCREGAEFEESPAESPRKETEETNTSERVRNKAKANRLAVAILLIAHIARKKRHFKKGDF